MPETYSPGFHYKSLKCNVNLLKPQAFTTRPSSATSTCSGPQLPLQVLKCNINLLKNIQLGLAFADNDGRYAPGCFCW